MWSLKVMSHVCTYVLCFVGSVLFVLYVSCIVCIFVYNGVSVKAVVSALSPHVGNNISPLLLTIIDLIDIVSNHNYYLICFVINYLLYSFQLHSVLYCNCILPTWK